MMDLGNFLASCDHLRLAILHKLIQTLAVVTFLMNQETDTSYSRRKNADLWKCGPIFDKMMDGRNNNDHINGLDKHDEIQPEKYSQIFHTQMTVESNKSQTNSQHQPKKYFRTLSETNVGYRPVSNTAKLKRVLSATELRTRLVGCPKGLLIATEPPKSGETYRRRSNTDVAAILREKKDRSLNYELLSDSVKEEINWQQVNWYILSSN